MSDGIHDSPLKIGGWPSDTPRTDSLVTHHPWRIANGETECSHDSIEEHNIPKVRQLERELAEANKKLELFIDSSARMAIKLANTEQSRDSWRKCAELWARANNSKSAIAQQEAVNFHNQLSAPGGMA